jgi:hypothetical protein
MGKVRIHNEWFQPIAKKTCPCGERKTEVFSWGEYVSGKWRTVDHFCQACFVERVQSRLIAHAGDCGCTFALNARSGYTLPSWIKMPETQRSCAA